MEATPAIKIRTGKVIILCNNDEVKESKPSILRTAVPIHSDDNLNPWYFSVNALESVLTVIDAVYLLTMRLKRTVRKVEVS